MVALETNANFLRFTWSISVCHENKGPRKCYLVARVSLNILSVSKANCYLEVESTNS